MSQPARRIGAVTPQSIESLEPRRLLSSTPQISFPTFASTTGMVFNGFGKNPTTEGTTIELTNNTEAEARSTFYNTAVGIQSFNTTFYFGVAPTAISADGFTFTLQNDGLHAVGAPGSGLGFQGIGHSFAVSFDLYNYDTNKFETDFRFLTNGSGTTNVTPIPMSPINLHKGDQMEANISYDGTTMSVQVKDLVTHKTFSKSEAVDLHTIMHSWTGYAGFTASSGLNTSIDNIVSWTYSGKAPVEAAPTVQTAAAASPASVTKISTVLSALGASDDGANALTYNWSTTAIPSGAKAVIFSDNGDNAAKSVTARFFKDGLYTFQCKIIDPNGQFTTSDVNVSVHQTATAFKITPHGADIVKGHTQKFTATILDQFNHALRSNPAITFSLLSGPGSINASTGVFSATNTLGTVKIKAAGDGLSGTVSASVVA